MSKYKVTYGMGDGTTELIIRDATGNKLEHFKINWKDKKRMKLTLRRVDEKYNNIGLDEQAKPTGFFDY